MDINMTKNGSSLVVKLAGRLDTKTAPEFEAAMRDALDDVTDLTFDLADLEYISSAGLRVLLTSQKTMFDKGTMTIVNVNEVIMQIFDVTGLSEIFTIE